MLFNHRKGLWAVISSQIHSTPVKHKLWRKYPSVKTEAWFKDSLCNAYKENADKYFSKCSKGSGVKNSTTLALPEYYWPFDEEMWEALYRTHPHFYVKNVGLIRVTGELDPIPAHMWDWLQQSTWDTHAHAHKHTYTVFTQHLDNFESSG